MKGNRKKISKIGPVTGALSVYCIVEPHCRGCYRVNAADVSLRVKCGSGAMWL